ncbi:MAG: nucleotidyl transferase AbiEii/AbiGii toxin family protein [Proteobacteria bacterium]|nr:nucleotidyl transferase AbiEii/AbiGii toxin family protein [Pseudomonadota bacterium]
MIPEYCLTEWRQQVPWVEDYQVEQDLIISRALVSLYENPKIKNNLVFRGGTALHKLYIKPAARYSEDIDLVQITPGPIGEMLNEIRSSLNWLGEPIRKLTERSAKLFYRYTANDNTQKKLKIEINTTEHFHVFDFVDYEFSVANSWFTGKSTLCTYQLNELMGTKTRALYQRRKGRDLFDLWIVLKNNLIDPDIVLKVFLAHCNKDNQNITRTLFEKNLHEKIQFDDFRNDILDLVSDSSEWSFDHAYDVVKNQLICLLPGKSSKIK